MKRLFIPLVVGAVLVFAAPAQAITADYCHASLRGQTSLAPDNDIYAYWQRAERYYGFNIVSSYPAYTTFPSGNDRYLTPMWAFVRANGQVHYKQFYCLDTRGHPGGVYEDGET